MRVVAVLPLIFRGPPLWRRKFRAHIQDLKSTLVGLKQPWPNYPSAPVLLSFSTMSRSPEVDIGLAGNLGGVGGIASKLICMPELLHLRDLFESHGCEIRLVGGVVRDLLSHKKPDDIDLSTTALPEQMMEFLPKADIRTIATGLQHGTVTAVINKIHFEITTLRFETEHDGRHCAVSYTSDWKLDATRRDLTINAMSVDLHGNLYDYFNGREHLESKRVVFVGDTKERLIEDYLRILRYFRFHGRICPNVPHEEVCVEGIRECASGLKNISGERIRAEIFKLITNNNCVYELQAMRGAGVLAACGMPLIEDAGLSETARILHFTNEPVTRLVGMIDNEEAFGAIAARWKLHRKEQVLGEYIIKNRDKPCDLETGKDRLVDRVALECVVELLKYQGKPDMAEELLQWEIPKFPVDGKALQGPPHNMPPGKGLGKVLKNLKERWVQSRFTLSKDELLSGI